MHGALIRLAVALLSSAAVVAGVVAACSSEPGGSEGQAATDAGFFDAVHDTQPSDQVSLDSPPDHLALGAGDLPPELGWLVDPAIWKPMAGVSMAKCELFEALPGKFPLPAIEWKACGAGCEETSPQEALVSDLYFPVASTHSVEGQTEVFLTGEQGVKGSAFWYGVRRVIRLRDGVTLGAVERVVPTNVTESPCEFGSGRESALENTVTGGNPVVRLTMTAPRVALKSWRFALPPPLFSEVPAGLIGFDTDHDGGQVFYIGKGSVWGLLDVDESDYTLLEPNSSSYHGAGEGDLAVWTDYGVGRIRGWAPDGLGVRTIVDGSPPSMCDVAPTPTHIIGFVPEGGSCDVPHPGRVWYVPRSTTLTTATPTLSPPLSGDPIVLVTSFGIRAWGDFAVLHLSTQNSKPRHLLAVQLSTWKTWRIDAAAGFEIQGNTFALTDKHLYYGEGPKGKAPNYLSRMRRIALDQLGGAPNVTPQ